MIALTVTYLLKEGKEKQALDLFKKLALESRKEPGCKLYVVHTDPDNSLKIFLYEQYQDGYALATHRASGHFKMYAENALAPIVESKELTILHPLV